MIWITMEKQKQKKNNCLLLSHQTIQFIAPVCALVCLCKHIKSDKTYYCQTSNTRYSLVGNKIVDHSDVVEASPADTASTTFHSWLNTWQLQGQTENIQILIFCAPYFRGLTAIQQYPMVLWRCSKLRTIIYTTDVWLLTHWGLGKDICITELGPHWSR